MTKAELLKKFFENECPAEEAEVAAQYLKEHPELLDEYLKKETWDRIDDKAPIHPDVEDSLRKNVLSQTTKKTVTIFKRNLAVAASVAALIFAASLFFNRSNQVLKEVKTAVSEVPATQIQRIFNDELVPKKIILDDASTVMLYPNASIEFPQQFKTNRSIQLTGKAVFDVAKDKGHPFTVYAANVATTAIGTRFLIDNTAGGDKLNVQLYEGKVVVNAVDSASTFKRTFLLPGQQCFIDFARNSLIVQALKPAPEFHYEATKIADVEQVSKTENVELVFDKTPLAEVFLIFQNAYDKAISFDSSEINGALFTGSFARHQNPESVLKVITAMNGLAFKEENGLIKVYSNKDSLQSTPNNFTTGEVTTGGDLSLQSTTIKPDLKIAQLPEFGTIQKIVFQQPELIFEKGGKFYFQNASLKTVINKIKEAGRYEILFKEEDVNSKFFAGEIDTKRSMIEMLSVICRMNQLTLRWDGNKYEIIKLQNAK